MTIIEVAQELQKDGTKRFTRELYRKCDPAYCVVYQVDGDLYWGNEPCVVTINDLLATDWEEVK